MLGVGSGSSKSGKIRRLVKNGLQAWYKADETQAPLGEEEVVNGDFSLGSELVVNGGFAADSDWTKEGTWTISGGTANRTASGSGFELLQTFTTGNTKTWRISFEITSITAGGCGMRLNGGSVSSYYTSVGVYTEYVVGSGAATDIIITANSTFVGSIDNVSVRQTDPNDNWGDNVGAARTWVVEEGKLSHTEGTGDTNQCRQENVVQANKKYQVNYSIVDYTSGSVRIDLGDAVANQGTARSALGDYSEIIINTGTETFLDIEPVAGGPSTFKGAISNISVREITNSVKDFSPNTNNSVLYSGKCLHFDQTNNYIDINYWASKTIDADTKATFATWVNPDDVAPGDYIFGAWTVDNTALFYLGTKQAKLDLGWGDSGWTSSVTSGTLPALASHTWYRVAVVVDGLTCKVYLNGEFVFSKTNDSNFTIHSTGISIGAQGDNVGDHFYGELADFQIYDKAWTASDVTYDYNNPDKDVFDNSNSSIETTNCTALYRLNEGAGDRLYNAAPVLREDLLSGYDLDNWIELSNSDKINSTTFKTTGSSTGIYLASTTTEDRIYKLTITGTTDSNGLQFANPSGGSEIYWDSGSSTGSFSDTITFEAKGTQVYLKNKTAGTTTITTLKLQEISLSDSYVQILHEVGDWVTAQPYIPQYAMSSYSKKMLFDGGDNLVDCGSDSSINNIFDGGGSWSAWFYAETDGEGSAGTMLSKEKARIRTKDDGGGDTTIEFFYVFDGNDGIWTAPTDAVLLNKINHIVVTYDNSSVSNSPVIYINGVSVTVATGTPPTGARESDAGDELTIGARADAANDCFDGFIDEVSVWDKELTATEAQEIFNAGMALDCRDHSGFLGDEEFDDPGFDDPLKWNISAGWAVSGGKASVDSDGNVKITQLLDGVTAGKMYDISFEISDYTQGSFQFAYGRFHLIGTSTTIPNVQGNGTYKYRVTAQGSDPFHIHLYSYNPSKFSIDNVSVKEVDLKGYWRNNGLDDWTDLSPYENDGDVQNAVAADVIQLQEVPYFKKDTFGLPMNKVRQKGLNFDGDSYVKVDDDSSLGDMDTAFTCAFWYRHAEDVDSSDWFWLVTKGTGHGAGVDNGLGISSYDNKIYAHLNTGDGQFQSDFSIAAASPSSPVWHYVTVTYNGSNLILYTNETLRESTAVTGDVSATAEAYPLMVGTNHDNSGSKRGRGVVDEVKWYNRALSLGEIKKNYKATKSRHSSTSSWSDDFSSDFI